MKNNITKDFVIYDYLSLDVQSGLEQLYVDCYQRFGWILTSCTANNHTQDYFINNYNNIVNIKFKRDRKIKNKEELLDLQKIMESSFKKVNKLKKEPELYSVMYSISIGLVGLLFLIFAFFTYMESMPLILSILNGILGVIGIVLGYFINNKVRTQKELKNEVLIEEQYDIIYDCCERANKLID